MLQQSQLRMPLPMVPIIQSGKAAAGKLNCIKEFMIVPSPGLSFTQVVSNSYPQLAHNLQTLLYKKVEFSLAFKSYILLTIPYFIEDS